MSEMAQLQATIPQKFQDALDSQASREDRQGFIVDLVAAEVLPRIPPDQRDTMCHVGAGRCHLARRLGDEFMATHVVEPNTYLLPDPEELEGLAVHTEDIMAVQFTAAGGVHEQFAFVLCDHLLHSLAISSVRHDLAAYLNKLVDELLQEGGVALLGTLAPRGPMHDFLSAINPAYVGSAAVQQTLQGMPAVRHWVVERSNIASLPSRNQLEQLLELHTFLVQLVGGGCAQLTPEGAGGAAEAPEPAGAGAAAATGGAQDSVGVVPVPELIWQFVADAHDGVGKWNFVEEDDYILVQKLPLSTAKEVWHSRV